MFYLSWKEEQKAIKYLQMAIEIAKKATCTRSKCGSIIVKNDLILWAWYNSPALNLENQRRCSCEKSEYHKKVTDKTCCIHAEQRAIMDALKSYWDEIIDSRLYFIRLDDENNMRYSWKPYCTICSKMALDTGVKEFVLWHKEWICVYNTDEYNTLSYQYQE